MKRNSCQKSERDYKNPTKYFMSRMWDARNYGYLVLLLNGRNLIDTNRKEPLAFLI